MREEEREKRGGELLTGVSFISVTKSVSSIMIGTLMYKSTIG
jgi:hypothetical protein